MTKTLTEQWREGTLPEGYYYITSKKWGMLIDRYRDQINDCGHKWRGFDNCQGVVEEVLAPVPSYTELTLMAGNYRLAKKALSDCYNEMKYWSTMNHRCSKIFNHIKAALVEIEEVK